jgi:serine/threonine-protein phosphatase 4 catalytic subunit
MDKGDIDRLLTVLWDCRLPPVADTAALLNKSVEVLRVEPNCLTLQTPITVCGDIHGQFYDLLELFLVAGKPPEQNFLFLGDYVDRGYYSAETFFLLLALKVRHPTKIYLLRGNHECQQATEDYGFYDEIRRKYPDSDIYSACLAAFSMLPLATVIDDRIFCVHGGLSPDLTKLADLQTIERTLEPPQEGIFADLLWSDPDESIRGFGESTRGAGYLFGRDVTVAFARQNRISLICRAHQVAENGYEEFFGGLLYTVWSAPNYCYRGSNLASVLEITSPDMRKFKVFKEAPPSVRVTAPESKVAQYFL